MSRVWKQEDVRMIAEAVSALADKVLYWKDRALRAETAERMFATEIYSRSQPQTREQSNG